MSNRRTPAWDRLMEGKGLGSYRRLADRAGISHEAARRVVLGQSSTRESIRSVAAALGVDEELVREMRGEAPFDPRAWDPPESARWLTDEERQALSRLIGLMTSERAREDEEHVRSAPIVIGREAARVERADPPPAVEASPPPTSGSDRPDRGE